MINKHSNISVGVYCNIFAIYQNSWSIRKEERYNPMRLRNLKDFCSWIYMCAYTFPSKTWSSRQAQCPFLSSPSWNAQDNLVLPTWRADDDSAILSHSAGSLSSKHSNHHLLVWSCSFSLSQIQHRCFTITWYSPFLSLIFQLYTKGNFWLFKERVKITYTSNFCTQ